MSATLTAALVGNPNAGKSALFTALTGARQKIANYPGVTVERRAGRLADPIHGGPGATAPKPDALVVARMLYLGSVGERFNGAFIARAASSRALFKRHSTDQLNLQVCPGN